MDRQQCGYTFLEALVTLAIAGILMAVTVPSLRAVLQNNRAELLTREFIAMISYARSEAIKRGVPVSLCAANDNNLTACATDSSYVDGESWANGWLVFIDGNSDGAVASNGDILKVHPQITEQNLIDSAERRVTFSGDGFPTVGTGNFTFQPPGCSGASAKQVTISPSGRGVVSNHACP